VIGLHWVTHLLRLRIQQPNARGGKESSAMSTIEQTGDARCV
jgi:hypothetical protein